jgi:hypothetical protein
MIVLASGPIRTENNPENTFPYEGEGRPWKARQIRFG